MKGSHTAVAIQTAQTYCVSQKALEAMGIGLRFSTFRRSYGPLAANYPLPPISQLPRTLHTDSVDSGSLVSW